MQCQLISPEAAQTQTERQFVFVHLSGDMILATKVIFQFPLDGLISDGLAHLDPITCAMLSMRRWSMHHVWTVLWQQRIVSEISTGSAIC